MDYVKDGTLTIQARTIKEVNSIDRVVVYADGVEREYLMSLPTVGERKEGEWIHDIHYGLKLPEHRCSICGEWEYSDTESNFCPNCGAHMKGE